MNLHLTLSRVYLASCVCAHTGILTNIYVYRVIVMLRKWCWRWRGSDSQSLAWAAIWDKRVVLPGTLAAAVVVGPVRCRVASLGCVMENFFFCFCVFHRYHICTNVTWGAIFVIQKINMMLRKDCSRKYMDWRWNRTTHGIIMCNATLNVSFSWNNSA